jgi:integrase
MEKMKEINLNEIEIHHDKNIVKYKGYEFQIIEKKYIKIGERKYRLIEPYIYGRNKKYRIDFQWGISETGKRIRKAFYFDDYQKAKDFGIKLIVIREFCTKEISDEEFKEIFKKIDEFTKYMRTPPDKKVERKIPVKKREKGKIPKIEKHGKKWRIRKWENGEWKIYSFDTYEEAYIFWKELQKEKIQKEGHLTLKDGIEIYKDYFWARKQDLKKLKYFLQMFNPFFKKWGNIEWYKINEILLEKYISERLQDINKKTGKNITEKTVKNELRYLSIVWNYLLKNGYLKGINYAQKILKERKFEDRKRERVLSYEEIKRLFENTVNLPPNAINNQKKAFILLGFFTGARKEEVLKLKKENIRLVRDDEGRYGIVHFTSDITKTKKERKIDIPHGFAMWLLGHVGDEKLLFPDFQNPYKKRKLTEWFQKFLKEKCNIENFYFHDFRHTWATLADEMGISLKTIKELGGWESYHSVDRYINRPKKENKMNPISKLVEEIHKKMIEKKLEGKNEM